MAHELYFLPILLDALDATQCREALREAFSKIILLGREPGYELGYARFKEFMKIVGEGASLEEQSDSDDAVLQFLISFCEGMDPEGIPSAELQRDPILYRRCQRLVSELQQLMPGQITLEIIVESGEEVLARLNADQKGKLELLKHIRPGIYRLSLSTGRHLWEGDLTDADVIWAAARPGQPFRLAADSGFGDQPPTRELRLLNGEISVRIFPGLEAGVMEVQVG